MLAPPMRALALFLVLTVAAPAVAAPSAFEQKYKAAVKLENAGNVVDALAAFEAIPLAERDFNTRLHIASCKRKLGRMLDAARDYESLRDDSKADTATKETAESDLEVLRAATPRLKLTAVQPDLVVAVDGEAVKVPAEKLVDPGTHVVTASRAGAPVFERKIPLAESTSIDVVVDVPLPAIAAPPAPAPAPIADAPPSDWKRPAGFVLGGVGVAALGLATYSVLRIGALERERDDLATAGDPGAYERASDARAMQTLGRVALGVGLVGLGLGTYFLLSPAKEKTVSRSVQLTPTVGTWGVRLEASW